MLSKKNRLNRDDFKQSLGGAIFHGSYISAKIYRNSQNRLINKYAVVVSGKLFSNKPLRNEYKRRVYEAVHLFEKSNPQVINRGISLVLYAKKEAVSAKFADIKKDVDNVLGIVRTKIN